MRNQDLLKGRKGLKNGFEPDEHYRPRSEFLAQAKVIYVDQWGGEIDEDGICWISDLEDPRIARMSEAEAKEYREPRRTTPKFKVEVRTATEADRAMWVK